MIELNQQDMESVSGGYNDEGGWINYDSYVSGPASSPNMLISDKNAFMGSDAQVIA